MEDESFWRALVQLMLSTQNNDRKCVFRNIIIDQGCVSNQEENPTQSTKGAISFLLWWVDVLNVLMIPDYCTHCCQGIRNSLYGFLGQAEALAVPIAARLDRISEFVRWLPNYSVLLLNQYFSFK